MEFLVIKWLHILSATILFGTGLGSAFYKWRTDITNDIDAIASVNRIVVQADWIFTTPTVIIQPATGFLLVYYQGYNLTASWLVMSIVLFALAGLCWIPVVYLQIKMCDIALEAKSQSCALPPLYFQFYKIWFWLGLPAFSSIIVVIFLMVHKPVIC